MQNLSRGHVTSVACTVVPLNPDGLAALPGGWLALTEDGLVRIADDGSPDHIGERGHAESYDPDDAIDDFDIGPGIHVSHDGRFAAVVTNFGRYGEVIDLSDGSLALEFDRGDDDNWTTYYPAAFLSDGTFVTATESPTGRMWAHQGRLHTVTDEGMEVWDPADGARTGLLKGFSPTAYNRVAGVFAQLTGEQLRTWR
ncbi:hypothetical protein [Kutzneria sp. NPDC051319]|uniref:hypothetical protein n=1 Tax=Kutzneria sp. NPDC051319 TaxID=3155047 RepID=UPI003418B5FA